MFGLDAVFWVSSNSARGFALCQWSLLPVVQKLVDQRKCDLSIKAMFATDCPCCIILKYGHHFAKGRKPKNAVWQVRIRMSELTCRTAF